MRPTATLCAAAFAASFAAHAELSVAVDAPDVRVVAPNLPAVKMEVHPQHDKARYMRLLGSEGPYTFVLVTPTADAGMKAEDCANFIAENLPKRPGAPTQEGIYKTRLDPNTYMAMYVTRLPEGKLLLNAHLLSSGSGNHCVEFVASKEVGSKDEAAPWFKSFAGARIETVAK